MAITAFTANELVTRNNVNSRLTEVDTKFTAIENKYNEYSLYYNAEGTQGTINLSDSVSNYSRITIYYRDDNWIAGSTTVIPYTAEVGLFINWIGGNDSVLQVKTAHINLNGSTITWWTNLGNFAFSNGNTAWGESGNNKIYIIKVVGYKQ